jgi:hypothetical protein
MSELSRMSGEHVGYLIFFISFQGPEQELKAGAFVLAIIFF